MSEDNLMVALGITVCLLLVLFGGLYLDSIPIREVNDAISKIDNSGNGTPLQQVYYYDHSIIPNSICYINGVEVIYIK